MEGKITCVAFHCGKSFSDLSDLSEGQFSVRMVRASVKKLGRNSPAHSFRPRGRWRCRHYLLRSTPLSVKHQSLNCQCPYSGNSAVRQDRQHAQGRPCSADLDKPIYFSSSWGHAVRMSQTGSMFSISLSAVFMPSPPWGKSPAVQPAGPLQSWLNGHQSPVTEVRLTGHPKPRILQSLTSPVGQPKTLGCPNCASLCPCGVRGTGCVKAPPEFCFLIC